MSNLNRVSRKRVYLVPWIGSVLALWGVLVIIQSCDRGVRRSHLLWEKSSMQRHVSNRGRGAPACAADVHVDVVARRVSLRWVWLRARCVGKAFGQTWPRALVTLFALATFGIISQQRKLLYAPDPNLVMPFAFSIGDWDHPWIIKLRCPGTSLYRHCATLYQPPSNAAKIFVYFHGNADQLGQSAAFLGYYYVCTHALGFYGIEYPGYGLALSGSPSEGAIYDSAEKLLDYLVSEYGVHRSRIVLFGQSLGCGVAVEMARRGHGSKMVLFAPFTNISDMAALTFPVYSPLLRLCPWILVDRYDNLTKAQEVRIPTLVVHGRKDDVVPFAMGEKLAHAIPGASLMDIPDLGHNELLGRPDVLSTIGQWAIASH